MVFNSFYELKPNSSGNGLLCTLSMSDGRTSRFSVGLVCTVTVPFSGMYGRTVSPKYVARCGSAAGELVEFSGNYAEGSFYHAGSGETIPFFSGMMMIVVHQCL